MKSKGTFVVVKMMFERNEIELKKTQISVTNARSLLLNPFPWLQQLCICTARFETPTHIMMLMDGWACVENNKVSCRLKIGHI